MSDNSEVAGRGTDTLPGGTSHSVPMKAHGLVYGVLAFVFRGTLTLCSPLRPRVCPEATAQLGRLLFVLEQQRSSALKDFLIRKMVPTATHMRTPQLLRWVW